MARREDGGEPATLVTGLLIPCILVTVLAIAGTCAGASGAEARQACRPVPGTTLEQFYPALPGWTRTEPKSETDLDEAVSRTTADFDRRLETISVEIMDSCRGAAVLQLIRQTLKTFPPATPGTTQRYTTVNGFPAYEEFTKESGHGELHVLVADRFMVVVTVETSDVPTMENAARLIPMAKMATIK